MSPICEFFHNGEELFEQVDNGKISRSEHLQIEYSFGREWPITKQTYQLMYAYNIRHNSTPNNPDFVRQNCIRSSQISWSVA